jgi:hypothetical protein
MQLSAVSQRHHFSLLSFAENMAIMILFGPVFALAARSH